jgi:hypothetical protein
MGSSPRNNLSQKCREGCVHKTQSGRTLPRTLLKRELDAPGCPSDVCGLEFGLSPVGSGYTLHLSYSCMQQLYSNLPGTIIIVVCIVFV